MKQKQTQEQFTEDVAWQEFAKADRRPFEVTQYLQARPAFDAPSRTAAIARHVFDASQALAGLSERVRRPDGAAAELSELMDEIDPATYRQLRVQAHVDGQRGGQQAGDNTHVQTGGNTTVGSSSPQASSDGQ